MALFIKLIGSLLIAVSFLPLTTLFGPIKGYAGANTPTQWALGLLIAVFGAWAISLFISEKAISRGSSFLSNHRNAIFPIVTTASFLALAFLLFTVSAYCFQHRPNIIDSVSQMLQANLFAAGQLSVQVQVPAAFFLVQNFVIEQSGWYSQYPPGHSALLALGVLAEAPWAVPLLLSLGTAIFLFLFTRKVYSLEIAVLALMLLALCPFFFFLGASLMNHVSLLFFLSAFLYAFAYWEEKQQASTIMLAGVFLGAAFLCRPLTAAAVGAVFVCFALPVILHSKRYTQALLGALAFCLVFSLYFVFNYALTGDAFLSGYEKLWGVKHGLGFHETPWGYAHSPVSGLRDRLVDLALFSEYLFEWSIPSLLPLGLFLIFGKQIKPWDKRLLFAFLALSVVHFFYWHRDALFGPRYLYAGVLFVLPLSSRAILAGFSYFQGKSFAIKYLLRPIKTSGFLASLLILSFAASSLFSIPHRFDAYAERLSSMKLDIAAQAKALGINDGLVFVAVTWGDRVLSNLREAGVPAPLVEKSYRSVDLCELHQLAAKVRQEGLPQETAAKALQELISKKTILKRAVFKDGRKYWLNPEIPPAPICMEEMAHDAGGTTIYAPHVLANSLRFNSPLVIARDLRERNSELQKYYPGKKAYLYRRGEFTLLESPLQTPISPI